jgi:pimeloyl-ACP methyl ester carboxylesterase
VKHVFSLICVSLFLRGPVATAAESKPCPNCPPLGIIFVVNGSGDDYSLSDTLHMIVSYKKLPLQLETIPWCRYAKVTYDYMDYDAQMAAAKNLAVMIQAFRQQCPKSPVYVIGHSAGCHVVLATAGSLPPDTVERIALLAPSVSNHYDLRPALRASRRGIAHFYSPQDGIVPLGAEMFGTADRRGGKAAGETGFAPLPPGAPDAQLYRKLRQYYWHQDLARATGHLGGHVGFTRSGFLDLCVLPLLFGGH